MLEILHKIKINLNLNGHAVEAFSCKLCVMIVLIVAVGILDDLSEWFRAFML